LYAYIRGVLGFKSNDFVVIEAGGIGYKIYTALSTISSIGALGDEAKIFTHLYVREDAMALYGFLTQDELSMFELLLSVSGVGPKAAISLISTVPSQKFCLAVVTDDVKTLTRAQGIGNKVAQRIILELRDKIKKEQLVAVNEGKASNIAVNNENSRISEAVSALMVLGYSPIEANRAILNVYSEDMELEAVIKAALKGLVR
jgi:Holliday junction DNA helicase RuvA